MLREVSTGCLSATTPHWNNQYFEHTTRWGKGMLDRHSEGVHTEREQYNNKKPYKNSLPGRKMEFV